MKKKLKKLDLRLDGTRVLALDMATTSGYASMNVGDGWYGDLRWGSWVLPSAPGARVREAHRLIQEQLKWGIKAVIYESPFMYPGRAQAFRVGCHMEAAVLLACGDVEVYAIAPSVVKKCATGKGNAKKDEVRSASEAWVQSLGHSAFGMTHDEADALAVLRSYLEAGE